MSEENESARSRFGEPIVAKQGNLFLICTSDGDITTGTAEGIYFHDMRYLSEASLHLCGVSLVPLLAGAPDGAQAKFHLTNPDIRDDRGSLLIRRESLGIKRTKTLHETVEETLEVENYTAHPLDIAIDLAYQADFVSMFQVRGARAEQRGTLDEPTWSGDGTLLTFRYDGADGHERSTRLHFSRKPDATNGSGLRYEVNLKGRSRWQVTITAELRDKNASDGESRPSARESLRAEQLRWVHEGVRGAGMGIQTDNAMFNEVLGRSFRDLHMLSMQQQGDAFFAAGVPWYVALFGRDSLITAIQMAAYEPEIAAQTLRVLASHQGKEIDDWRDEQPGKILHELRVGEMANLDEIPQTPYYGSVDSTPLFLILLGIHASWSGALDLFHELHDATLAALEWIDKYGDSDGDGFIDYKTHSKRGLRNQGWKDSGNGIVMQDGSLAEPPIALPEVQGEVYLAWSMVASLFERDGDTKTADRLRKKAARIYEAFNREFWLSREHHYAFCRQADGRFSKSVASNPAHALWTGIVDPKHSAAVVDRVMQPDMFSGWGIRTLSSEDHSYNPVDYQVGSIWPHDNAMIVAGMHRYGHTTEANRVFSALIDSATRFRHYRLPETFAGYDRGASDRPVRYPVACNPQAWAAGAIPFMLQIALGLQPDAANRRLNVEHPWLPDCLDWVAVHQLNVGDDWVDLRYRRSDGITLVAVEGKSPGFTVSIVY